MSSADLFLAVDQGGHASRALVFDARGAVLASAYAAIDTLRPGADRVEHDAGALLASVHSVLEQIAATLGKDCARLRYAGLATQRSSIVCWDRDSGEPLSNVISWQDRRAAAWLETFGEATERVHRITGLMLSPHYGASKLNWCFRELPAVAAAARAGRLASGPLSSFLLHRTLDEHPHLADPANASRTLLWDYRRRDWSSELLRLFAIPRAPLPRCVPSRHRYGTLRVGGCRVPLRVCTGDQSAALYALGEPPADIVFINLGTGAFLQRAAGGRPVSAPRLLGSVVYQDRAGARYVLEGTINGAGSALTRIGAQLQLDPDEVQAMSARWLQEASDPPLFLNGVAGLGSPYWVADFDSRFIGDGEPREKIAAVLESIVFLIRVNLDELTRDGAAPRQLTVTGGLASVDPLCQRIADLSELPVARPTITEATARGLAFLLAGRPADWPPAGPEASFSARPNAPLTNRFERWRKALEAALGG